MSILSHHTPSSFWVGALSICHPRGQPQNHKTTRNTAKITQFGIAVYFEGKEEQPPQNHQMFCLSGSSYPFTLLWGRINHALLQGPPQNLKVTKIPLRWPDLAWSAFLWVNSPLKTIKYEAFLICPAPSLSWGAHCPSVIPRAPPQNPDETKNTLKIARFGLALFSSLTLKCLEFTQIRIVQGSMSFKKLWGSYIY